MSPYKANSRQMNQNNIPSETLDAILIPSVLGESQTLGTSGYHMLQTMVPYYLLGLSLVSSPYLW